MQQELDTTMAAFCQRPGTFAFIATSILALLSTPKSGAVASENWIVWEGGSNRIRYHVAADGDRVPDFSDVGYRGGNEPIPRVPTLLHLQPIGNGSDDTDQIQSAIDDLSSRSRLSPGFQGAVELAPGRYEIRGTLKITASGIVLRGAGSGRTTLAAQGRPRAIVTVGDARHSRQIIGARLRITDSYVPVGARALSVASVAGLTVGDSVIVQRPWTSDWITEIGMDAIPVRSHGLTRQWAAGSGTLSDRRVVQIRGNEITLDAPLMSGISSREAGVVWRYSYPGRVTGIGIEDLAADGSEFLADPDYVRLGRLSSKFILIENAQDAWLSGLRINNFMTSISLGRNSSRLTAYNFSIDNSENVVRSGAAPFAISIAGQQILIQHCAVIGRSIVAWATQSRSAGPNVVYDCHATGVGVSAGSHQRWATGVLLDNISVTGSITLSNRGNRGTGQGWSAANSVVWNSISSDILVENPPGARNWSFGAVGAVRRQSNRLGEMISPGIRVLPDSLFQTQLNIRLRPGNPANDP
jgi:hypothetical protein